MTANIEQRLRTIEDRIALLDLEAAYAAAWDFGRAEAWAELFTEGGTFEMLAAGDMQPLRVEGHLALRGFCEKINEEWQGLHYMHPPRLEISGDEASSLVFFEFRHSMKDKSGHVRQGTTAGYYRTRYVRTPAGWRIASRVEKAVFESLAHAYGL